MKRKQLKNEAVVFNLEDPDQYLLWKHLKSRTNVSAYLKRLIQRDMEGGVTQTESQPTSIDQDAAESFI